jgi:hypothetical protein
MHAWLVTWESPNDDPQVATILPAEMSKFDVARILEALHAQRFYTLSEQRSYAENAGANPYPAVTDNTAPGYVRITCGHNPFLEARMVRELTVTEVAGSDRLVERVSWEEQMHSGEWEADSITQRYRGGEV